MKIETAGFRLTAIAGIGLVLCIAALYITALFAERNRGILLALPKDAGSFGIDVFSIDDFAKLEFPITYEISFSDRVILPHSQFPVTVISTSAGYSQILKFPVIEGSFFTNQAWSGKLRHAVLNEKAAFDIFGSVNIVDNRFRIRNDTYIVTGVIKDENDDVSCIYIPSSVNGGRTNALAVNISDAFDETFIGNSLKTLGVMDVNFNFINFNVNILLLRERITVMLLLIAGFLLLSLFYPFLIFLKKSFKLLKNELEHSYLKEIFWNNRKLVLRNILPALGLAVLTVLSVIIFIKIVSICLPWQDIPSVNRNYLTYFYPYLERIYTCELISVIVFLSAIAFTGLFFISLNIKITSLLKEDNS